MEIHEASVRHLDHLLSLRKRLWPPDETDDFETEIMDIIKSPCMTAFLVYENENCAGFAEIAIRDYADGCSRRNVGYLEGIYVEPAYRQRGFAMSLIRKAEEWLIQQGCVEIASDSELDNQLGIRLHKAAGFDELKPAVRFIKKLKDS